MEPKTFVVPLDGSEYAERAVTVASALAQRVGGRMVLFTAEFTGPLRSSEYLDEVAQRDLQCPVETYVARDRYPAGALVEMVEAFDDRMVCMTTHGRGRVGFAALGSVAEEVMQRSARPTLLVGHNCRSNFLSEPARVLIASAGAPWPQHAAECVRSWADMFRLDVRVALVAHPLDIDTTEHPERVTRPVAAQFGVAPDAVMMVHADYPQAGLERVVETLPASLLAIGAHDRSGLTRVALGSVTMNVVRHVRCPVLAIPLRPRIEAA